MSTEEIILTLKINRNRRRTRVATRYDRRSLNEWYDDKCKEMTRFKHEGITRICNTTSIGYRLKFNDFKVSGELPLAILLTHLSFPRKLHGMSCIFRISTENVSRVVNGTSKLLFEKFIRGIEFDERQFSKENLERFSQAFFEKGAIIPNIVGFIDGTMQHTCRPKDNGIQKLVYNGWKRIHCIKFQGIVTSDGITSSLCGPYHGSQNDPGMFNSSEISERLSSHFDSVFPEKAYAIYGDEAYSLGDHVIPPFSKHTTTDDQLRVNRSMSKVRSAVEMGFGKTVQLFGAVKWKYNNKVGKTKPGLKYILATTFKNIHTCIHGSASSRMFKLQPPTLEEYISRLMREQGQSDLMI